MHLHPTTTPKVKRLSGKILGATVRVAVAAAVVVGLASGPGISAAQAQDTLAEIKKRGAIRLVGVAFPPYIVASPDGSYGGIDYDILKGYADSIGVKIKIVPGTWGTAIAGLRAGKWDVAPVMCWKPERVELVTFLESHYNGGLVIAVRADKGPFTIKELNNPKVRLIFPAGTFKETFAKKYFPNATVKKITKGSDAQVTLEILSGRADTTLLDAPIGITKVEAAYPGKFKFLPSSTKRLPNTSCVGSLVVRRNAYRLAAGLNDHIKNLKVNGKIDAYYKKHIKAVLKGKI